jgi:hypothetical protein
LPNLIHAARNSEHEPKPLSCISLSDAANLSLPDAAWLSESPVLSDVVQDQLENRVYVDAAANCGSLITENMDIADEANIQHASLQHVFINSFRLLHQPYGSGFDTLINVKNLPV